MKDRLYRFFRSRSIYYRIHRASLTVAIVSIALLAAVFIYVFFSSSVSFVGSKEQQALQYHSQNISSELYYFDNEIVKLTQLAQTQSILDDYLVMSRFDRYRNTREITDTVVRQLHVFNYVTDVMLVTNNFEVIQVLNGPHDDFRPEDFDYVSFVKKTFSQKSHTVLDDVSGYRLDDGGGNRNGILYAKRIADSINNSVNIGYIIAYLDKEAFFRLGSRGESGDANSQPKYILNPAGGIIHSNIAYDPDRADDFAAEVGARAGQGAGYFYSLRNDPSHVLSLCAFYPISDTDWYVVSTVPYGAFMDNFVKITVVVLLLIVGITLGITYMSTNIVHSVDVPIQHILHSLHRIESGDFTPDPDETDSNDELTVVQNSLNYTTRLLAQLFADVKEAEWKKYELQLQALQAQMNPHFLMNVLNSVILLADLQGADNIEQLCRALSRLLQETLKGNAMRIAVEQELALLNDYALIMQYRYFDRFQVVYDVDPEALQVQIPRFLIQPLIENSLLHGMDSRTAFLSVFVTMRREGDRLAIEVRDNGLGISQERLNEVRSAKANEAETQKSGKHIGLRNIAQRLELLYGSEYSLTITGRENEGFCVLMKVPIG